MPTVGHEPAASARLAVTEALTNLVAADVRLTDVALSANWMAAAGFPGEDARLFEAVRAVHARARMIWVGDGPARSRLRRANPEHVYAGVQHGPALAAHYASADLFVFPSLTETFGNVTLEALASGLALVAFDEAAAAQHARDGVSARLVASGDEDAFVQAAAQLAAAPSSRAKRRANAPELVAHLSWPSVLSVRSSTANTASMSRSFQVRSSSPPAPAETRET